MTEVSERYERLSGAFAAKIAAVPAERWAHPSPCKDWTARDLVRHVVATQGMFLGLVGDQMGDIPSVDADPGAAWDQARATIQARLDDPAAAAKEFIGFSGPSSFEAAVNRFLCTDLVVHGWDLARATGLDEHIDADDIARVQATAEAFGDTTRGPQAFGPAIPPPPDADDQTRLLCFLGRQP